MFGTHVETHTRKDGVIQKYHVSSEHPTPGTKVSAAAPTPAPSQHVTETPAFTRWFGNSKIVDGNGKPRVLYHATTRDFDEFKVGGYDSKVSGHGIWLSPYQDYYAAGHHIGSSSKPKEGTRVLPLYARVERPLLIDDKSMLEWARDVFADGSANFPQLISEKAANLLREDYDGIIFDGEALGWGDKASEIIVLDPKQLKSAIGNAGTFDPSSPHLNKSLLLVRRP